MKNRNNCLEQVENKLSEKSADMKRVFLADKLHKHLQEKSMEQVLSEQLPAEDADQLKAVARELYKGIDDMYASLDSQVSDEQVKARLNKALADRSMDERGKYLVNLLNCSAVANSTDLEEEPRWQQLKDAENFQKEDVDLLLNMVSRTIDNHAGFMARQEFLVAERALDNHSPDLLEKQMNSGKDYAAAYAAANYITSRQPGAQDTRTACAMGQQAAHAVESCHILALYHCGKLRMEEAMPKLKALAKELLVQAVALTFRVTGSVLLGMIVYDLFFGFGLTDPILLMIAAVSYGALVFFACTQDEMVEMVLGIWEGCKALIGKIMSLFRGDAPPPSGSGAGALVVEDEVPQSQPVCEAICMTV